MDGSVLGPYKMIMRVHSQIFSIEIKNVAETVYFHKKIHFPAPKRKQDIFQAKKFVDS